MTERPDLDRLVANALAQPEAERAVWLAEACGNDDALRTEIRATNADILDFS